MTNALADPSHLSATTVTSEWRAWFVPSALLVFSCILLFWLNFRPEQSRPVVVFFSPGTTADQSLTLALRLNARIVAFGSYPNSIVVQSDRTDFFDQLRRAGAWLIADATGRTGCNPQKNSE